MKNREDIRHWEAWILLTPISKTSVWNVSGWNGKGNKP